MWWQFSSNTVLKLMKQRNWVRQHRFIGLPIETPNGLLQSLSFFWTMALMLIWKMKKDALLFIMPHGSHIPYKCWKFSSNTVEMSIKKINRVRHRFFGLSMQTTNILRQSYSFFTTMALILVSFLKNIYYFWRVSFRVRRCQILQWIVL